MFVRGLSTLKCLLLLRKNNFPTRPGYVQYIFACYDVFSRLIKLVSLKSATTKVCLNKLVNHYSVKVIKPKLILSDNASQFRSPSWWKQLQHHGVDVCDLNPSDIRSRTQVKGACMNCQNSAASTVMTTIKIGKNCFHIHKNGLTTQSPVGLDILPSSFGVKRPNVFDNVMSKCKAYSMQKT